MKLGIAYNLFNGNELLRESITRLRKHGHYIVLTFQTISNVGNKADNSLQIAINSLDKALYDDVVEFYPNKQKSPKRNETDKRQLGLLKAKEAKCTHFMSVDCDEFYRDEELVNAKNLIIKLGYKSTACELVNYFHSSKYQMIEKKRFVPFICEIGFFTKFKQEKKLPVNVDSSRVARSDKFYLFPNNKLLMHHMSYVRVNVDSMKSKLENSPNNEKFKSFLDDYLNYYQNWTPNLRAMNPHEFKTGEITDHNIQVEENPIPLAVTFMK
jgi:hypothetical protein